MTDNPTPTTATAPRKVGDLERYTLRDEKPNWQLAFEAHDGAGSNLYLYGESGLRDFLDYLDDTLSQAGVASTLEKYQAKRDQVAAVLLERFGSDEVPADFDVEDFMIKTEYK